ncbi:hypothetical protein BBJ28_00002463 [Nothophytophthora sp. Chile5]|nr:hypothetical protein BBJ28_00002463 [Nothophytophthora sp. Chile5]
MSFAPLPVQYDGYPAAYATQTYRKDSASFRRLLKAAVYARSGIHMVPAQELTPSYLHRSAFDEPLLVAGSSHSVAGLDEPFPVLDTDFIASLLAENRALRTCDVATQEKNTLLTSAWQSMKADSESQEQEAKRLANAEFRLLETSLRAQVAPPIAVTEVDWHYLLPSSAGRSSAASSSSGGTPSQSANPNIFGVFLSSHAYLDFALAPGGQCTWLSVSDGELWAYLIPPTTANTRAFREWKNEPNAASQFLAEQVDKCIKCVVTAGSSLLLPAGWMYAQFAGDVQSCSLYRGFFACTAALDAQLAVVALENQHNALSQYWRETASGWLAVDANVQLWTAVCSYVRRLLVTSSASSSDRVSDQERRALMRALPRLREWSASPDSLKSVDGITWTPSSLREAQAIVGRLEQALAAGLASSHSPRDLQPTMGLAGDGKLPPISPNEASYIYSAASTADSVSGSPWGSQPTGSTNMNSSGSSFVSTTPMSLWADYEPLPTQQQDHLVISTQSQSYLNNPALQHHQNLQVTYGGSDFSYLPTSGSIMADNSDYLSAPHSGLGPGLEGLGSLGGLAPQSLDLGSTASSVPLAPTARGFPGHAPRLDSNGNYVDVLVRHRASCHRCGNLRKKNVRCPVCPHIFCQKCAEKMLDEHGDRIFVDGCPVCKEQCCCGKNRTTRCTRKFHCYKKCPATKRPAAS